MSEEKQNHRFSIKVRFGYVIAALIVLITLYAGYRVYQMNHFFVDGSIRREPGPATNARDLEDFEGWIKSITFEEDPVKNEIRVLKPIPDKVVTLTDLPLVEELYFSDGEQVDIPQGGKLRVIKYGFTGEKNENDRYPMVWKQTVDDGEVDTMLNDYPFGQTFHQRSVACLLESEEHLSMWVQAIRLRDKQTGYYYNSNWGYQPLAHTGLIATAKWTLSTLPVHQRPIELVFDVYCGEKIIRNFPLVDKHVETMGDYQVALVKAYATKKNSGMGGGDILYGFSPDGKSTGVRFNTSQHVAIQIRAMTLNGEGKQSSGSCSLSSSCGYSFQFDLPYNEIESFEITTWTDHYRAVYTIDEILTLPDQTNSTDNLLKTKIKSIEFQQKWEFNNFWSAAMLLHYSGGPSPSFPLGYFPKKFEDVTVEELFLEYLEYIPNHGTPEINEEEGTLKIPPKDKHGWLEPVLEKTF